MFNSILFKLLILLTFNSISQGAIQFRSLKELPQSLTSGVSEPGWSMRSYERLDYSTLRLDLYGTGRFRVQGVPGYQILEAGNPILPASTRTITVPNGFEAKVILSNVELEESVGPVPMEKIPSPHVWGMEAPLFPLKQEGLFPGKLFKTVQNGNRLTVHLYPVQFNHSTGQVIFLKSAEMWVNFIPKASDFRIKDFLAASSIILTSRRLESSAKELQAFHHTELQTPSDLVFIEDLEKVTEPESEENLPDGYKDAKIEEKEKVVATYDSNTGQGYHYQLARKIIRFIQNRIQLTGTLKYVTILGDGGVVPPSYYFALPSTFNRKWGVTDQCYSSTKKCLEPQIALGRLPFRSDSEVRGYLEKAKSWLKQSNLIRSELSLIGGKAFPNSTVYVGELGALEPIQSQDTNWVGVKKYFRTKFNYSKKTLLGLAEGKSDSRFVYALDHGKGNQWYSENEFLSSKDVEEAIPVANPVTPVVVSIACTNAAFDSSLSKELIFGGLKYGERAVGPSLLASKGGAISYWGSARPGLGSPVYDIDVHGNLEFQGTNYGLQLLKTFFDRYRAVGKGRMGDIVLESQKNFVFELGKDLDQDLNIWTYYIATLLGDPVLTLPERPTSVEESFGIGKSTTELKKAVLELPLFSFTEKTVLTLTLESMTKARASILQLLQSDFGTFMGERLVTESSVYGVNQQFPLTIDGPVSEGTYFVRLENEQGVPRERQVWFSVTKEE